MTLYNAHNYRIVFNSDNLCELYYRDTLLDVCKDITEHFDYIQWRLED